MWTALKIVVALAVALAIYLAAARVIRAFHMGPAPEPDPSDLRPVHHRYRCVVCYAEVTMTAAPGDDVPEPPRHCREDMALVVDSTESG